MFKITLHGCFSEFQIQPHGLAVKGLAPFLRASLVVQTNLDGTSVSVVNKLSVSGYWDLSLKN